MRLTNHTDQAAGKTNCKNGNVEASCLYAVVQLVPVPQQKKFV